MQPRVPTFKAVVQALLRVATRSSRPGGGKAQDSRPLKNLSPPAKQLVRWRCTCSTTKRSLPFRPAGLTSTSGLRHLPLGTGAEGEEFPLARTAIAAKRGRRAAQHPITALGKSRRRHGAVWRRPQMAQKRPTRPAPASSTLHAFSPAARAIGGCRGQGAHFAIFSILVKKVFGCVRGRVG